MAGFSDTFGIVASGMSAQAARIRHTSENIANADTPGYHRKTVAFREELQSGKRTGAVQVGPVRLDLSQLSRIYDPEHPLADATGHYDGSNVNLMIEIADAREAQRSYEANLKIFEQVRQMSSSLLELLRR
ncbi:flagellar basal body rod protein FlgC [Pelagovum pacificum]|uniref:Flagellar basal body rod protein FlgB n=1 Tax=Pelagovum pacificum TaxID=2588711 RepID=A0A5C5GJ26_9RHOB|nr:flagellar basal body rod protein FlgC [Pelagovum pacificum]QQA45063.1 flagellar basal body rod protein FlgC [Pelagovum pacificum]TNY33871.1 flagellar basal body rod protein FlgC [Pelagovum pacificum]